MNCLVFRFLLEKDIISRCGSILGTTILGSHWLTTHQVPPVFGSSNWPARGIDCLLCMSSLLWSCGICLAEIFCDNYLTWRVCNRHRLCSTTFELYHPIFFSKHSIYVKDNSYLSFNSKYIGYQKLDLWGFISKILIKSVFK